MYTGRGVDQHANARHGPGSSRKLAFTLTPYFLRDFDQRWLGVHIADTDWQFHRKLFARYGIVLAPGEYSAILRTLRSGQARLIKARGKRTAVYSVRVRSAGKRIYVLAVGCFPKSVWSPERVERLGERLMV